MTSKHQLEQWRIASLAYYYRQMRTHEGRIRLNTYKRNRRWAIRRGLWPTQPLSKP